MTCVGLLYSQRSKIRSQNRLILDLKCRLHLKVLEYERREINLCSPYPSKCLLLLKGCTACYLSRDRLIKALVINRAFSLSCPWEDLSTYPQKINIPDQWNTHKPASSCFLLSVKNKPQLIHFDFNSCWLRGAPAKSECWPWPLNQFVRLLLTHSCLCKNRSPHRRMNTQTAALWPSGPTLSPLCWYRGQEIKSQLAKLVPHVRYIDCSTPSPDDF